MSKWGINVVVNNKPENYTIDDDDDDDDDVCCWIMKQIMLNYNKIYCKLYLQVIQ